MINGEKFHEKLLELCHKGTPEHDKAALRLFLLYAYRDGFVEALTAFEDELGTSSEPDILNKFMDDWEVSA